MTKRNGFHRGRNGKGKRLAREERLQIMLRPDEVTALDNFRFTYRMPSRAAAVRELIRRGLGTEAGLAQPDKKSTEFGVVEQKPVIKST